MCTSYRPPILGVVVLAGVAAVCGAATVIGVVGFWVGAGAERRLGCACWLGGGYVHVRGAALLVDVCRPVLATGIPRRRAIAGQDASQGNARTACPTIPHPTTPGCASARWRQSCWWRTSRERSSGTPACSASPRATRPTTTAPSTAT